jgi:hypothetical protein
MTRVIRGAILSQSEQGHHVTYPGTNLNNFIPVATLEDRKDEVGIYGTQICLLRTG